MGERERQNKMAMELKVKNKVYKVKFGYNSFCDTDLLDRTNDLLNMFNSEDVESDADVAGIGRIKDLFCCVRDLLFVGFEKFNPVDTKQAVGDILDDYHDEATENDKRGLFELFTKLAEELMNEGFLKDMFEALNETEEKQPKTPQDHKKKEK